MPWQRQVIEVGTEYDPGTMQPFYRGVTLTVPRQSGKTTLLMVVELLRILCWGNGFQNVAYTAQTGSDARQKLLDDQIPVILASEVLEEKILQVKKGIPTQVKFHNGGRIDVLHSSAEAGHGRTIHLAIVDEAMADLDDRREQSLMPAMSTVADAQLWVVSTAGTDSSVYLRRKVETGRVAAETDKGEGIAYFEWSAPKDADPDDQQVWRDCMPALGHTITESAVSHARSSMSDGEFRRAYLNQWISGDSGRIIPIEVWEAACDETVAPDGRMALGIDATPERTWASIAISDDKGRVEVIDHQEGVGWVTNRVVELARRWGAPISFAGSGPLGHLATDLERSGVIVVKYQPRDLVFACGVFYDAVIENKIQIRSDARLDMAVAGAAWRSTSSGGRVWGRVDASVVLSPLMSASLAYDVATRRGSGAPTVMSLHDV